MGVFDKIISNPFLSDLFLTAGTGMLGGQDIGTATQTGFQLARSRDALRKQEQLRKLEMERQQKAFEYRLEQDKLARLRQEKMDAAYLKNVEEDNKRQAEAQKRLKESAEFAQGEKQRDFNAAQARFKSFVEQNPNAPSWVVNNAGAAAMKGNVEKVNDIIGRYFENEDDRKFERWKIGQREAGDPAKALSSYFTKTNQMLGKILGIGVGGEDGFDAILGKANDKGYSLDDVHRKAKEAQAILAKEWGIYHPDPSHPFSEFNWKKTVSSMSVSGPGIDFFLPDSPRSADLPQGVLPGRGGSGSPITGSPRPSDAAQAAGLILENAPEVALEGLEEEINALPSGLLQRAKDQAGDSWPGVWTMIKAKAVKGGVPLVESLELLAKPSTLPEAKPEPGPLGMDPDELYASLPGRKEKIGYGPIKRRVVDPVTGAVGAAAEALGIGAVPREEQVRPIAYDRAASAPPPFGTGAPEISLPDVPPEAAVGAALAMTPGVRSGITLLSLIATMPDEAILSKYPKQIAQGLLGIKQKHGASVTWEELTPEEKGLIGLAGEFGGGGATYTLTPEEMWGPN